MDTAKIEIISRIVTAAVRLGLQLRNRDAEALAVQLEEMGRAPRADVEAIEGDALRRLQDSVPTSRHRSVTGPLEEGD